jgi:type IV pilus assembly protein PilV
MKVISRQRGVSLIEVLVAVLIFSVGLVGMAALLLMSTRSNQAAYLRTQVAFLANNMADRMRANPAGVWANDYNVTFPSTASQTCDSTTACTPAQLANHDIQTWNSQLSTFLPSPTASISCSQNTAGFTPSSDQQSMNPPFGGTCKMQIQWAERAAGDVASTTTPSTTQTFFWEFQP